MNQQFDWQFSGYLLLTFGLQVLTTENSKQICDIFIVTCNIFL